MPQVLPLAFQIGHCIGFEHPMLLEKAVELVKNFEAEHAAKLGLGQPASAVGFGGQRFERLPFDIADGTKAFGEIIGYMKDEIHD
jgi:hypothetical protein